MTHLNFQLQNLNATAEFNILHSSFRIHIVGKRFYTCRLAFELTFFIWPCSLYILATLQTNFYTLLLFISFDAWTSTLHLTEMPSLHSILTRRISPVTASNFKLNVVLLVFSVTSFKIDKNQNQNRSTDKVQNLGNERRYIYKDPRQDSGQRNISYTRYSKKRFTQIYKDLYGDAMLVLIRMGTNMADGNQRKHLLPSFATKTWIYSSRNS